MGVSVDLTSSPMDPNRVLLTGDRLCDGFNIRGIYILGAPPSADPLDPPETHFP